MDAGKLKRLYALLGEVVGSIGEDDDEGLQDLGETLTSAGDEVGSYLHWIGAKVKPWH